MRRERGYQQDETTEEQVDHDHPHPSSIDPDPDEQWPEER